MTLFLSYLINGISLGSVYAIIALGYTMVYGIAKMLNFAHGDVIMIGAYVSFCAMQYMGLPAILSVVLAMAVCTVLGIVIEGLAYKPLRQAPSLAVLITAIGVSYFLQNLALLIWGSTPKSFSSVVSIGSITLLEGQLVISGETIVTILANILIMIALTQFTSRTKFGKAMRAVSEDKGAAELMGINVNATISMTFAIGSALLRLSDPSADDRLHAGHQGVYRGCFRRHRLYSGRNDWRRVAGRHRDFGQGVCLHRAGRRARLCRADSRAAGQADRSARKAHARESVR